MSELSKFKTNAEALKQSHDQKVDYLLTKEFNDALKKSNDPKALQVVIDQLKAVHFNDAFLNIRNLRRLPDHLKNGEVIKAASSGSDQQTERLVLIVVTNQRLFFESNPLIGSPKFVEFSPDQLHDVVAKKFNIFASLKLKLSWHKIYYLNEIDAYNIDGLVNSIRQLLIDTGDDGDVDSQVKDENESLD